MYHFLQAKINYIDEVTGDPESITLLCNGFSFSDSEEIITKYLTEFEDILQFDVTAMSRVKFEEFYDCQKNNETAELFKFFNVKVSVVGETGKEKRSSFLLRCKSVEEATKMVNKTLKEEEVSFEIKSVSKLEFRELVVGKFCDILGLMVVAYSDQREIEITTERMTQIEEEREYKRLELGADEIFTNKFKINFNESKAKNLKKVEKFKGRQLARRILKTWNETFVDEDSGEVVAVERNEVLFNKGVFLDDDVLEEIKPFIGDGVNSLVFYI